MTNMHRAAHLDLTQPFDFRDYLQKEVPPRGAASSLLTNVDDYLRYFPLNFGTVGVLSIQAGRTNYSRPRQSGLDPHEYEAWEVAIMQPGRSGFICRDTWGETTTQDLPEWLERFGDLWGGDQVIAYMETADVQALVDAMRVECMNLAEFTDNQLTLLFRDALARGVYTKEFLHAVAEGAHSSLIRNYASAHRLSL
jgi:hypothetical protein